MGDPVDVLSGQKQETYTDYSSADGNLSIRRSYALSAASNATRPEFGQSWFGITPATGNVNTTTGQLSVSLPNGFVAQFTPDGNGNWVYSSAYPQTTIPTLTGNFPVPANWGSYLASNAASWTLRMPDGSAMALATSPGAMPTAVFAASTTSPTGFTSSYLYGADPGTGRPLVSTITGADARQMKVTWADTVVTGIALPDGTSLRYDHSAATGGTGHADQLTKVSHIAADGSTVVWSQSYVYENTSLPYAVTGMVDALGNRRTQDTYNSSGQVVSNAKADGTEVFQFAYAAANGSTVQRDVMNPAGKVSHYVFTTPGSPQGPHLVSLAEDASASSAARSLSTTIGSDNNVQSQSDFRGTATLASYDTRSRPTSVTLASGTSAQRSESTTWLPTLDKPQQEVLPGKTIGYGYDATGRLIKRTETDTTTGPTSGQQRIWQYSWTALGKMQSVTGPRPIAGGKTDLTTFGYDSANNLTSVTNPLGQVTRFSNYDANGRPGQMTEASGLVTNFTYDAIGRLKTHGQSTAGVAAMQSPRFGYDAEGQLTSISPHPRLTRSPSVTRPVGRVDQHSATLPGTPSNMAMTISATAIPR